MDLTAATTALNTTLGDDGDVTFTSSEKQRALKKAWNDSYVVQTVWDDSLTYTQGTYQYALPNTLTTVKDIYVSPTGSVQPFPEPIDSDLYELIDGKIQFNQRADNTIPTGYTLYIKGNYKLETTDTLDTVNLQEYVIALAGVNTLTLLTFKKANLFVKNDVSMSELIGLRRELTQEVKEYRQKLLKEYESA